MSERLVTWGILLFIFLAGMITGINLTILGGEEITYDAAAWKPPLAILLAILFGHTLGCRA